MTKIVIIISYSLKFYVCIKKSQDWETKAYGIIDSRVTFSSNYYTKCQDNTHWHSAFKYFVTEIVWPTFLFILSTRSNLISESKILPTWKFSPSFQKYFILFSMIVELRKCFINASYKSCVVIFQNLAELLQDNKEIIIFSPCNVLSKWMTLLYI